MMSQGEMATVILNALKEKGFPTEAEVQGRTESTGLDKLADALAKAIVEYIQQSAEVVIPAGTFLIAAQAGVPNPASIILKVR